MGLVPTGPPGGQEALLGLDLGPGAELGRSGGYRGPRPSDRRGHTMTPARGESQVQATAVCGFLTHPGDIFLCFRGLI